MAIILFLLSHHAATVTDSESKLTNIYEVNDRPLKNVRAVLSRYRLPFF